ncbi:hypothetical protein [Pelotomaculum propionicicum]|uniref:Uncharacterized protein n=1 Tax=Pelotomaculum propionicicum TaxID=258475 RepID=A0A4Y7RTN2_9FIRM|nr:hypothetical protein [Pelotomaculum propionicicum]NLI14133.1 hypothetical protein [Peptococcaceae bacterium]TEB12364.1 hypothetical protein Pmgp_00981 [Pelotomaculum propionicicum]
MENARILDERLKRIIGEVGHRAGSEIRRSLLQDMENSFTAALEAHCRRETEKLLKLFSEAVNKI